MKKKNRSKELADKMMKEFSKGGSVFLDNYTAKEIAHAQKICEPIIIKLITEPNHQYVSVIDIPTGTFLENTDNDSSNISPEDVIIVRVSCTNERRADGSSGVEIDTESMREEFENRLKETIKYYEENFD